jgi:hypothetical protein
MIDPDSRHGRELKAAEEFFALARITPSAFMRSYYQRVAERYLSSEGELRTWHFSGLPAALGSATSPPQEPPPPSTAAEPASQSVAVPAVSGSVTSPPHEAPPPDDPAAAEPASQSVAVTPPAVSGSVTSPPHEAPPPDDPAAAEAASQSVAVTPPAVSGSVTSPPHEPPPLLGSVATPPAAEPASQSAAVTPPASVGSATLAEAMIVDRTSEIATLRQKLAAAEASIQERGRHNMTEADKDNLFKRFTSWTSEKVKGAPTLDDMRQRMAALLRDTNNVEG